MTEEETHKCTACSCDYTDDEGGIQGNFGILPMSFCPTCLSSIFDMVEQLNPREWIGLTDDERRELWWNTDMSGMPEHDYGKAIEAKLKEANGYE